MAPSLLVWRATRIARRSARARRLKLQAQLSACTTHADQRDLQSVMSRYPDAQTEELRALLPPPPPDPGALPRMVAGLPNRSQRRFR